MVATIERYLKDIPFNFLDRYLGGTDLRITSKVAYNGLSLTAHHTLPDTGANGYLFVNRAFAQRMIRLLNTPKITGFKPHLIGGFDGKPTQSVSYALLGHLRVQGRTTRNVPFIVLDMKYDIIIGRKWFVEHDVAVDPRRSQLLFPPHWEADPVIPDISRDEADTSLKKDPEFDAEVLRREKLFEEEDIRRRAVVLSAQEKKERDEKFRAIQERIRQLKAQKKNPEKRPVMEKKKKVRFSDEVSIRYMDSARELSTPLAKGILFLSTAQRNEIRKMNNKLEGIITNSPSGGRKSKLKRPIAEIIDISVVGAPAFARLAKKQTPYVTSLCEIDRYIQDEKDEIRGLKEDTEEFRRQAIAKIPECYHDLLDEFSKVESDKLPPHRQRDHKIEFVEGKSEQDLHYSPLYKMSLEELEACREYIVQNLHKGFIEPSSAPWAAPILFVPKANGGLRLCVDYRKLNAITRKDRYPLPLIEETLARVSRAKIFTKVDIRQAFHRIRMDPNHEDLTTFRTRYGAYKYKVMPFGLANGPSSFQRYINDALIDFLDEFCSAYVDDVLIYSDSLEEHKIHVRRVLERLQKAGLQVDLDKCEFHVHKTKFLGFIVGVDGVSVDPDKIAAIVDWQQPDTVKGVQSFLGFCNFYRKFIRDYGRIAKPLNNLTRKGEGFYWSDDCQAAFEELKRRLVEAPVLAHFRPGRDTKVETDASDGVVAGVLSQLGEDGEWHPVAFYSSTMAPAETRYGIHDKELLAIIRALENWRAELVGMLSKEFLIVTDHKALEYFSEKRKLNGRQVRWVEFLAQYNFQLTYRPGTQNAAADALSRKSEDLRLVKDRQDEEKMLTIFKPAGGTEICAIDLGAICDEALDPSPENGQPVCIYALDDDVAPPDISGMVLTDRLLTLNKTDPSLEIYRERARQELDGPFTLRGGTFVVRRDKGGVVDRLVVPETENLRVLVLNEAHKRLLTAHPGRNKMRKIMARQFWWPGMMADVDRYVNNCLDCASAKTPRDKTPGLLRPLPVPQRPWQHLVVDFKSMPKDREGYNNVFVMIDRLSKFCWTAPCRTSCTAAQAALLYYEGPYRIFGLPESVVSDRGPQFISAFIDELSKILGIKWKLSSAGHSQTAGQAEIMNAYIDQRLRPFINHAQDNWRMAMPAMDNVQATLPHESTGLSPHEVLFACEMPSTLDWSRRTDLEDVDIPKREKEIREGAQKMAQQLMSFRERARSSMEKAQGRMIKQANKHRREPDFGVGDKVFIRKKVWSSSRPSDKLDFPLTRNHYKIKSMKGLSYELEVPDGWKGSRVFHADRLRKFPDNPLPGQANECPEGDMIDEEEEWEVDQVITSRLYYNKLQYQVQWRGWDPDPIYYDAESFKNATTKLREYHAANPEAPGPPLRISEWEQAALADEIDPPHPEDNASATEKKQLRRSGRKRKA